ncbi:hypothetical protein Drose_13130 [Dactylosporangium roseum]|uniref:Uncharacterized protein n=1 Tax=Dactylosporangium roseum TaxID=47989 RepID=A0ABY5ZB36_9ACTN|nr:hypothetical protein [Dactylosporangium roseum]UWZ39077.1 hypothetical protein Drose_13130 [Dactylosporangium roseum]
MGALADRLDRMRMTVHAPGGKAWATLIGSRDVTLSFLSGYYGRVDERELAWTLTAVARLLWVERTRALRAAVQEVLAPARSPERPPRTAREVAFDKARDELVAEGYSPGRRVVVTTLGLRSWQVRVAPGTIRALDEQEFCAAVRVAADGVIQDVRDKMIVVKAGFEQAGAS